MTKQEQAAGDKALPVVEQLRKALEKASQGEWDQCGDNVNKHPYNIASCGAFTLSAPDGEANAAFIALAHNLLPSLLDAHTALEQEAARLREVTRGLVEATTNFRDKVLSEIHIGADSAAWNEWQTKEELTVLNAALQRAKGGEG